MAIMAHAVVFLTSVHQSMNQVHCYVLFISFNAASGAAPISLLPRNAFQLVVRIMLMRPAGSRFAFGIFSFH